MKVLVIGSGGREHALVWKISQSPLVKEIFCASGNAGMAQQAKCVAIEATDIPGLLKFAKEKKIDLTVVGPEAPLVAGIVNQFEKAGLKIFGPTKEAAQLEGSKVFSKEFMKRFDIPTAEFHVVTDMQAAARVLAVLKPKNYPVVIKADGLAAGKGVIICNSFQEAKEAVSQMLEQKIFKEAGARVVIEEFLEGEEVSILIASDGQDFVILDSAQDHKRIFDDDLGPNTGGMGAYSPTNLISKNLLKEISTRIVEPTIAGMDEEGHTFKGILYAGLMLTDRGPFVLEYNVRFGDPETQAIIPRFKNDLVEIMLASVNEDLSGMQLEWDKRRCVCVVLASGGYPGAFETGKTIQGLRDIKESADTIVFHAATKNVGGEIVTSGGRVLGVTGLGSTIEQAVQTAYKAVDRITFEKCFFRRDIGAKAFKKVNI